MSLVPRFGAGTRLFLVFAALSLVPVLALGGLLAVQFRHEVQGRGIDQARGQAEAIARMIGETQLDGHSLRTGLTAVEEARLLDFARSEVRTGNVTRLRLRGPDARVVFSDDGSGIDGSPDEEAAEALEGESEAEITRLNSDHSDTGPVGEQVVEVYTAIHNPRTQDTIGVLEIYLPYQQIAADLRAGLHRLYLVLALGLGLLYLLLAGLSGWTTRRLGRQAAQFQHLAMHDALTDLPNRALFADRIGEAVAEVERHGGGAAVVVIDLDRFREINDTLGHRNGDLLLTRIADRLLAGAGPGDTVARLGGDEFGLVLPGVQDRAQLEAGLVGVRAAIEEEVELSGLPVNVEASLGVVFIPRDGDHPDLLIQHADVAMYVAKQNHGGVVCYDTGQDHHNAERLALVSELRRAVLRNELVLHYQPQVSQPGGEVCILEALVRWQHPTRGLLLPDAFIPIAEQTGLIDEVTRWVLDTALAELVQWRRDCAEVVVAVNISARSLQHLQLPTMVKDALERAGAEPDWLLLEITETALMTDATRSADVLGQLSAAGHRLSLDDFGQGYTSLSQLSELPLSELKIDKSFVLNMLHSRSDAAIVRSIIDLGHNLEMNVVAEGVEEAEVVGALLALGCDVTQGFWFSRRSPPTRSLPGWPLGSRPRRSRSYPTRPRTAARPWTGPMVLGRIRVRMPRAVPPTSSRPLSPTIRASPACLSSRSSAARKIAGFGFTAPIS
jgi:diguanylate cyclase (GGDEF)-like protein